MADTYDIEQLPELVRQGTISKREGADFIWTAVYQKPLEFGLFMDEDEKSEFLLYMRRHLETIFDDFKPGIIKFKHYVRGLIRNTMQTWVRKRSRFFAEEATMHASIKRSFEAWLEAAEAPTPVFDEEPEEPEILSRQFRYVKKRRMAEKIALILALKNCHTIDEETIEHISKFTHIEKETILEKINNLKNQSEYKSEMREKIIQRRDNAFFYHRKYLQTLQRLQEGTATFETVLKKYQLQTECWIRQNKLLAHRFVLSPSNVEIARELGLKPRQVSFYINHVKKHRNNPFESEAIEKPADAATDDEEQNG